MDSWIEADLYRLEKALRETGTAAEQHKLELIIARKRDLLDKNKPVRPWGITSNQGSLA